MISGLFAPAIPKLHATILVAIAAFTSLPSALASDKTPVVLISIDTLRADHLGAYGYTRLATPNIDSLGGGGTIYQRIDAQVPMTLPSHTVLMTSTNPFENHVQVNFESVPAGAVTLASVLHANGYRTAAFIGSMVLERRTGLVKGFDTYDSPFAIKAGEATDLSSASVRRDASLVTGAARQWIDQNRAAPLFAFIHIYDLHTPYTLPTATGITPSVAGYDLELAHVDQVLGQLWEALKNNGLWDKALIVLLADHGESLGDHGETGHGYFIYESTLHVPLIIHWPTRSGPHPRRSTEAGGLIDVAPTILDFLHIAAPQAFKGMSLLSERERTTYGETVFSRDMFGWAVLRSLRSGPYKYIDAPEPELYDLLKDPRERMNVFKAHPDEAHSMKARIDALTVPYAGAAERNATVAEVPASTRAMLGSLGYTSGPRQSRSQESGSQVDPKDRVKEAEAYQAAEMLVSVAQYGKAVVLLQQIVTEDPKNFAASVALSKACRSVPSVAECKGR